ncbi:GTPase [Dysgonomonas mossii]|uniref:GTPase n=1 Tax=Dysgonomonas mossii TaxID=163665 RepID=UPI003992D546
MNIEDQLYLISSYLIVADEEINDRELNVLNACIKPSEYRTTQQSKIFSDDDEKITLEILLASIKKINAEDIKKLLKILFSLAYADDFFDPKEISFINRIKDELNISPEDLKLAEEEVINSISDSVEPESLSWTDILKGTFSALIYELKSDKDKKEEYELLSGAYFSKKIKDIANASKEDLTIVEEYMSSYSKSLENCFKELEKESERLKQFKREDQDVKVFTRIIEQMNNSTKQELRESLNGSLDVLNKKKRSIHYFTIAFMGRTKAGKSSLHKVVTHEKSDNIGEGRLRTTRYNRSWYWESIRIVDTPGIGAPGGKSDTETAKTIIDEADLVCYVVTNDSIQETEFDFLKELKERSKPLFIILNIKENLEHPVRLKRFLENPLKWKTDQGDKNIQGHFDRIRECIGDSYDFNFIEIIPLQLLAAQLYFAENDYTLEQKQGLLEGANLKEFIYKIKQSVYRTGGLKKTQNIFDGCGYQINTIIQQLSDIYKGIESPLHNLRKKKDELTNFIKKEQSKACESISKSINNGYTKLEYNAKIFSLTNYEKENVNELWKNNEENKNIYETLRLDTDSIISDFTKNVKDRIEECFDDLDFETQQTFESFYKGEKNRDWKFGMKITSALVGVGVFALLNWWNPLGWATAVVAGIGGMVSVVMSLITSLFDSKEDKIKKAQEKLYELLIKEIKKEKQINETEIHSKINMKIGEVSDKMNDNLSILIEGMDRITSLLKKAIEQSKQIENKLNSIFAYRLLQQLGKVDKRGTLGIEIDNIIEKVSATRSYKDSTLSIESSLLMTEVDVKLANMLTQLNVKFNQQ